MSQRPVSRRRQMVNIALCLFCAVVVASLTAALARKLRHDRCLAALQQAHEALNSLEPTAPLRADLTTHLEYLQQRLCKDWSYRKRDFFLSEVLTEINGVGTAATTQSETAHRTPGHHVLATRSAVDDALLPTSVSVPHTWDGSQALPLVLILHAGGVTSMGDCFPAPKLADALVALPLARGSHDYLGVQMTAVEECVADLQHRYPISKVLVFGQSMGGMGAWLYAQRNLESIAGLSPWCGNSDPGAWRGYWPRASVEATSPAGQAALLVRDARAPISRIDELSAQKALPIYVGHGARDSIIPVEHSRVMVERLQAAGANVKFDEFIGLGHKDLPTKLEERVAWLLAQPCSTQRRRVMIPALTFQAMARTTPPHRVLDPQQPASFSLEDGSMIEPHNVASAESAAGKHTFCGPAGATFERAFEVVLPPNAPQHLLRCAEELSSSWQRRYQGTPRRAETLGSDTALALGSPEENPGVAAALSTLDVKLTARRVHFFGKEFVGEDLGLIMLRPHPFNPRAGVLIVWGSTPAAYCQLWTRFGQAVDWEGDRGRWWFDYALFDRRTCGPDSFLAVGFLDHDWRFQNTLLFEGNAPLRRTLPGSAWATGAGTQSEVTYLSALEPTQIVSERGPIGFDRSAGNDRGVLKLGGVSFERGIGLMPPATISWDLGAVSTHFSAQVGLEHTDVSSSIRTEAERVRFEVWGDGKQLAASAVLSAGDAVQALQADVTGINRLELRAINTTTHLWHYGPAGFGEAKVQRKR